MKYVYIMRILSFRTKFCFQKVFIKRELKSLRPFAVAGVRRRRVLQEKYCIEQHLNIFVKFFYFEVH